TKPFESQISRTERSCMHRLLTLCFCLALVACAGGGMPALVEAPQDAPQATGEGAAAPAARQAYLLNDRLIASDRTALPLRYWRPWTKPRAALVALHGFNDYSNAFEFAGVQLAHAGYAVYAYDQRGFGGAPGRGLWMGEQRLAEDATTAVALVRAKHPGVP